MTCNVKRLKSRVSLGSAQLQTGNTQSGYWRLVVRLKCHYISFLPAGSLRRKSVSIHLATLTIVSQGTSWWIVSVRPREIRPEIIWDLAPSLSIITVKGSWAGQADHGWETHTVSALGHTMFSCWQHIPLLTPSTPHRTARDDKYQNVFQLTEETLTMREEITSNSYSTSARSPILPERKDPKLDPLPGLGLRKSDVNFEIFQL